MFRFCEKCNSTKDVQKHHIIPIGLIKLMKYEFVHTISNEMFLCQKCHERFHRRFCPDKFYWKKLADRTLKMRSLDKFNNLINEMKQECLKL